jgi:hypothetical protein
MQLEGTPSTLRNLIANIRTMCEQLPQGASRRFGQCLLLRTAQWALDGKETTPKPTAFLARFSTGFIEMRAGLRSYISAAELSGILRKDLLSRRQLVASRASQLTKEKIDLPKGVDHTVITSPPYLGIHVLYNRWQLNGRKEIQAPYFIADCKDLGSPSKYTIINRQAKQTALYFHEIEKSFHAVSQLTKPKSMVIQLVAFPKISDALPQYLTSLSAAGLEFCEAYAAMNELHIRHVPNRRWYARVGAIADSESASEILLIHRTKKR